MKTKQRLSYLTWQENIFLVLGLPIAMAIVLAPIIIFAAIVAWMI